VPELKRLAAASVNRTLQDVAQFEKLGKGGFNRTFLVIMRDGFQLLGWIPYPVTQPKHLVTASEVATQDFVRVNDIPVPKIYGYSTALDSPAGTEHIFVELVRGTTLGDIWFDLPEKAIMTVVTRFVQLESQLFALRFPASGSLYYAKNLDVGTQMIDVPDADSAGVEGFCVGHDTRLPLWYGK